MNYRHEVTRTVAHKDANRNLINATLGLCGEAGEVADLVKKHLYQGHALNREELIEELGDLRWYFELFLATISATIEEVEVKNVAKLRKRYPNGFETKLSVRR